jgi:hypothetical protein
MGVRAKRTQVADVTRDHDGIVNTIGNRDDDGIDGRDTLACRTRCCPQ